MLTLSKWVAICLQAALVRSPVCDEAVASIKNSSSLSAGAVTCSETLSESTWIDKGHRSRGQVQRKWRLN